MIAAPSQSHSETSQDAARRIVPASVTLRARVLDSIRHAGSAGMTDDEIQTELKMNPSTQRPRRIELVAAGLVYDSLHTRPTASGREAVVWVAAAVQGEMF